MGSPTGDSDEQPAHKVYVDAFSMDVYEVTVGQYAALSAGESGSIRLRTGRTMNQSELSEASGCQSWIQRMRSRFCNMGSANDCRQRRKWEEGGAGNGWSPLSLGATSPPTPLPRELWEIGLEQLTGYWRR